MFLGRFFTINYNKLCFQTSTQSQRNKVLQVLLEKFQKQVKMLLYKEIKIQDIPKISPVSTKW